MKTEFMRALPEHMARILLVIAVILKVEETEFQAHSSVLGFNSSVFADLDSDASRQQHLWGQLRIPLTRLQVCALHSPTSTKVAL